MAADQAAGANIKEFAQMLTTDHTNDYQQLSRVAGKAGLTVPKGIDAKGDKMIAPFEKLKGAAFDTRFAREMVAGHQKAIAQYKQEVSNGQNADIKAYAAQALPVLERHLQGANELRSSGKSGKVSEKM
jgi:putative membrane protein